MHLVNTATDRRCRGSVANIFIGSRAHTGTQYTETGSTKPRKHLSRSNLALNNLKDFLKTKSLSENASRESFSN